MCALPGDTMTTPKNPLRNGAFTVNTKIKNTLLILLVAAFVLTGCAATMEDDFLPDTEALPFATPTPIPQLTLKDVPRPTPSPTPAPSPEQSEAPAATQKIITAEVQKLLWRNLQTWKEKQERPGFDGRLLIPAAGIDVGLFSSGYGEDVTQMRQNITDALDSALLYYDGVGFIIADHSNQDFASLPLVQKGDRAYILEGNSILTLSCSLVTDGVNTGEGIRDINGEYITDESLFTCYTCLEDWTHIHIVGFKEIDEDLFSITRNTEMEGGWAYEIPGLNEVAKIQLEEQRALEAERAAEAARAAEAELQQQSEDLYN